ncbi:MAG: RusA family crossover junction endodeoxyribonuclease [Aphanocapsa sp. GSE-SYN-MK-11-07L]|jgi:Holliday junction resolvase RusA-like endonuclease|nr:RusA family crossover junction endodeoxyribonuclease [Aphanocapsa sp. GSE-SYN-MK-11-07L]
MTKARARHNGHQTYTPANSRQWKEAAIAELATVKLRVGRPKLHTYGIA